MPIISKLINALIFWGNFLQDLSARVEEAQAAGINPRFWAWMEAHFVPLFFDGEDHTENALAATRQRTYGLAALQLWKRAPGPIAWALALYFLLN